jgi:hypothetical protein
MMNSFVTSGKLSKVVTGNTGIGGTLAGKIPFASLRPPIGVPGRAKSYCESLRGFA